MSRRGLAAGLCGLVAVLLVISGTPAGAQGVQQQFFQGDYSFTCQRLDVFHGEQRAVLRGNVEVWNDTSRVLADRLVVHYVGEGDTVEVIEAFENVEITNQDLFARGEYARYEAGSDTMFLRGDAYIRQGRNEFQAARMWFDFTRRVVNMRDSVKGNVRRGGGS